MFPGTRITYTENGSGRVEYNAYNTEDFLNSNEIPKPKYVGGLGDTCDDNSQCHSDLYCYSKTCSHWSPFQIPFENKSIYVKRSPYSNSQLCTYKEDCPGGWVCVNQTCQMPSSREGFKTQKIETKPERTIRYTSHKQNSGKNYYLYDETK